MYLPVGRRFLSESGMIRRPAGGLVKRMNWIRASRIMRKNFSFTGRNKKETK